MAAVHQRVPRRPERVAHRMWRAPALERLRRDRGSGPGAPAGRRAGAAPGVVDSLPLIDQA